MPDKRLMALDVFRGLTICLMIIVNNPGSWAYVYPPLRHAEWNGYTPTDLVFPFFMFIVGVSLFYSFSKVDRSDKNPLLRKIIKRTFLIFLCGFFLNIFPFFNFEKVRIMGVLQRIALSYGLAAILVLYLKPRMLKWAMVIILFTYWGLLYLSPMAQPLSLEGNLVRLVDLRILGEQHMYKGFGIPFDPEGLLSSLPGVSTILLGYFIAMIIKSKEVLIKRIQKLVLAGLLLLALGMIWNHWFPINKPIWSSSYVLVTAGWATLSLAILLYLIDALGIKKIFMPFVHYGVNPLFVYMLSGVYVQTILFLIKIPMNGKEVSFYSYMFNSWFQPLFGNFNGSLAFALFHAVVFWFVAYILYRKKIFIKL